MKTWKGLEHAILRKNFKDKCKGDLSLEEDLLDKNQR